MAATEIIISESGGVESRTVRPANEPRMDVRSKSDSFTAATGATPKGRGSPGYVLSSAKGQHFKGSIFRPNPLDEYCRIGAYCYPALYFTIVHANIIKTASFLLNCQ